MNWRHFQYLTEKEMEFIDDYTQEDISKIIETSPNFNLISCQCYNTSKILTEYNQVETVSFYRDLRAHWKHNYLEICRFEKK